MGTCIAVTVHARCPLCGSRVLSLSRHGRVVADDLHPVQLGAELGRGYSLCDDCGILANLPTGLTLN
jgi:DNA-directed RNA polymerase subunit RPC12/RpoP